MMNDTVEERLENGFLNDADKLRIFKHLKKNKIHSF